MQNFTLTYLTKTHQLILVVLFSAIGFIQADDWSDKFNFNGYYSLDFTYVDDDVFLVSTSENLRKYKKGKFDGNNSLFGGQLEYQFTDNLSAFIQGSVYIKNNNTVATELDWAYFSYAFDHDITGRVGRFQIPFLSGTELRKVGFTRLWVRPLIPGDGASGNEYITGLDVIKRFSNGLNNWEFQLSAGKGEHGLSFIDNKQIQLISAKYQRGNFWVRSALMHSDYSVATPRGMLIRDNGHAILGSVESEFKVDKFQLNLGYSATSALIVPEDRMAYFSLAYQFNSNLTPYILGVNSKQRFTAFDPPRPNGPPGNGPPPMGPPPMGPPPNGDIDTYSLAVGTRIDIGSKMALKFQFENTLFTDKSRIQNGITSTNSNAFSIVLEGVF